MVFALVVLVANSSNVNSQASWSPLPGMTPSTPALGWHQYIGQVRIVVRASDDSIWGATLGSDGSFGNNWAPIPGRTPSTPALAANLGTGYHDMLMVVRDSNGGLWKATFNYTGGFNNDWQPISGRTPSAPALIRISNGFMLVVRGSDNSIWTATFNSDGVFNNDWESIPGATPSTPALAWDYSTYGPPPECLPHIMIVARGSDNSLWKGGFDNFGNFISNWVPISGLTPSSPALGIHSPAPPCSYAPPPELWVRGQDNSLWYALAVGNAIWSRVPGATPSPPAVLRIGTSNYPWFWVVVRGSDDSIWLMREW